MTTDYKIQILMLEDNDSDAEMVMHALSRSGLDFEIQREEKRETFLNSLEQYKPDIIISDYNIPGYNGRQAYLDMTENGHRIPFILVTGSLSDDVAVDCLQTGIDDYIIKDRLGRLPEAVAGVLAKWRTEEEKKQALEKLIESQKRLAEAEKLTKLGNWEWNVSTNKVTWSDEMYRIFEVLPREYDPTIETFVNFFHPDDIDEIKKRVQLIISGKENKSEIFARIITGLGSTKIIHSIYHSDNNRNIAFGTIQDVTKQKETEKALRELTEKLELKVKERTSELSNANTTLAHRNKEITDGISYARRIQKAIFNKPIEAADCFNGTFMLLMPKDIVSGDFFWHYDIDNMHFLAAVDCTGHGVPGALMSMIAHQFLCTIVTEQKCYEPAEILKQLDKKLMNTLHQHLLDEVRDGMDIALCRIDEHKNTIHFAGALRPLFYFNGNNLQEIPGSKNGIGGFSIEHTDKIFRQTDFTYKKGDCIYLTSDGYYSQFNYYTGKKMMKNRMRNVLESVAKKEVDEQHLILKRYFNEWKGDAEQVDDVLVIGVKF
ncbi:MAG: SpoIIE family protein phosphatase [Bacteroidia bacterium]